MCVKPVEKASEFGLSACLAVQLTVVVQVTSSIQVFTSSHLHDTRLAQTLITVVS
jgi:hypothetical protein